MTTTLGTDDSPRDRVVHCDNGCGTSQIILESEDLQTTLLSLDWIYSADLDGTAVCPACKEPLRRRYAEDLVRLSTPAEDPLLTKLSLTAQRLLVNVAENRARERAAEDEPGKVRIDGLHMGPYGMFYCLESLQKEARSLAYRGYLLWGAPTPGEQPYVCLTELGTKAAEAIIARPMPVFAGQQVAIFGWSVHDYAQVGCPAEYAAKDRLMAVQNGHMTWEQFLREMREQIDGCCVEAYTMKRCGIIEANGPAKDARLAQEAENRLKTVWLEDGQTVEIEEHLYKVRMGDPRCDSPLKFDLISQD